jgi:bifunctional non-homologous end joining protein LigD
LHGKWWCGRGLAKMQSVQRSFPDWMEPMAATLTRERFTGPEWVFEQKLDGIRLLAFKRGRSVQLFSRNRLLQNAAYPDVLRAVERLAVAEAILDGEALGVWGREGEVGYHLFDVMWLEGRDLTALTLDDRRAMLDKLSLTAPLHLVQRVEDREPWERARREGWEGVIAKRRDSPYEQRRSRLWLKTPSHADSAWPSGRCWSATSTAATSCSPVRSVRGSTRRCFTSCVPS